MRLEEPAAITTVQQQQLATGRATYQNKKTPFHLRTQTHRHTQTHADTHHHSDTDTLNGETGSQKRKKKGSENETKKTSDSSSSMS